MRRYTRVRNQNKSYLPSISGNKYSYALTQMENIGILHPKSHMFSKQVIKRHDTDVVGAIMTHLSLKEGLRIWGKKCRDAIHSETKQLHMRETFLPIHCKNMSYEQRNQTLESHLYLKQNRDITIKGRTVAGVNKQIYFISK